MPPTTHHSPGPSQCRARPADLDRVQKPGCRAARPWPSGSAALPRRVSVATCSWSAKRRARVRVGSSPGSTLAPTTTPRTAPIKLTPAWWSSTCPTPAIRSRSTTSTARPCAIPGSRCTSTSRASCWVVPRRRTAPGPAMDSRSTTCPTAFILCASRRCRSLTAMAMLATGPRTACSTTSPRASGGWAAPCRSSTPPTRRTRNW